MGLPLSLSGVASLVFASLLTPTRAQPQCHPAGGDLDCPCISSYEGLNFSSANEEERVVSVDGMNRSYGTGSYQYGLHYCRAHDSHTAPYCNVAGFPSWCSHSWCYVNASCARSMSPSLYAPGLHYSYETCDATDSFTSYYTHRDGVINLCSVFSTEAAAGHQRRGCGDTDTLAQVGGG